MGKHIIEVPDEMDDLIEKMKEMDEWAREKQDELDPSRPVDYAEIERELAERILQVERAGHGGILRALDVDAAELKIHGGLYKRVGRYTGTYKTMAGPVSLERSLYRAAGKRNSKTVDTVSLLTGVLEDGWLPHTARTMAFLLSQQPSREAANAAHELGRLPYHRSSFERIGHAVGQSYHRKSDVIEERLIEKVVVPDAARSISVSIDRVSLPMEEEVEAQPATKPWPKFPERPGWPKRRVSHHRRREIAREMQAQPARVARVYRMAYCATVTLHDADSKGVHTIRYGKMPATKPQTLCHRLAADIYALRTRRPDLNVSFVADEAPEIWNLFDAHLSKRTIGTEASRTIDYYHLMEYLAPAAHLMVARKKRAAGLIEKWKELLLEKDDGIETIYRDLCKSRLLRTKVDGKTPVGDAKRYVQGRRSMMQYKKRRALGLPIGSGHVEARRPARASLACE